MKRLYNLMLAGLLIVTLSACGKQAGTEPSADKEQYRQTESVEATGQTQAAALETTRDEAQTENDVTGEKEQQTQEGGDTVTGDITFNFETKTVLLNSGYEMPVYGIGTFVMVLIITLLFNSPFSILLPKLSEEPGAVEVLAEYTEDFRERVQEELADPGSGDETELIYEDYEGDGEPDNMADILMVYMVKHGFGDTATVMTQKNKKALKDTFDEMTSLDTSYRTEIREESYEEEDFWGNVTIRTEEVEIKIKEVRITLLASEDIMGKVKLLLDVIGDLRSPAAPRPRTAAAFFSVPSGSSIASTSESGRSRTGVRFGTSASTTISWAISEPDTKKPRHLPGYIPAKPSCRFTYTLYSLCKVLVHDISNLSSVYHIKPEKLCTQAARHGRRISTAMSTKGRRESVSLPLPPNRF